MSSFQLNKMRYAVFAMVFASQHSHFSWFYMEIGSEMLILLCNLIKFPEKRAFFRTFQRILTAAVDHLQN